jgi:hypothetical protein
MRLLVVARLDLLTTKQGTTMHSRCVSRGAVAALDRLEDVAGRHFGSRGARRPLGS